MNNKSSGTTGGIIGNISQVVKSNTVILENVYNLSKIYDGNNKAGIVGRINYSSEIVTDYQFIHVYDCNEIAINMHESIVYQGESIKMAEQEMKILD